MTQNWYPIFTEPRQEIKLFDYMQRFAVETGTSYEAYLPMTELERQWSDRKKRVKTPLFKNYLFVKHDDNGFHHIKTMPGFGAYLRFGRYPLIMREEEISRIKTIVDYSKEVGCIAKRFVQGERVRIRHGALAGYEGVLLANVNNQKVAITVEGLDQYLQVQVPINSLVKVEKPFNGRKQN